MFTLQITDPATGAYTFTLLDQLDHGLGTNDNDEALLAINLSSILVATDADGDFIPLSGGFIISVENDIPQIIGTTPVTLQLDEDGLAGANADSAPLLPGEADFGEQTTANVDLTTFFSVGADQPGTFQFTAGAVAALDALPLTSGQLDITFALNAAGDTITGSTANGNVLTLNLTTDGSLTVTLLDQIDHTFGDNVESNLAINLGGLIAVVDQDGDALAAASGDIVLNIGDDIPQIIGTTPVTLQLDEDGLAGANADSAPLLPGEADFGEQTTANVDLTTFFSVGADQPGTFQFTAGAVAALDALPLTSGQLDITFALNAAGDTITGSTANGNDADAEPGDDGRVADGHVARPDRPHVR